MNPYRTDWHIGHQENTDGSSKCSANGSFVQVKQEAPILSVSCHLHSGGCLPNIKHQYSKVNFYHSKYILTSVKQMQ